MTYYNICKAIYKTIYSIYQVYLQDYLIGCLHDYVQYLHSYSIYKVAVFQDHLHD